MRAPGRPATRAVAVAPTEEPIPHPPPPRLPPGARTVSTFENRRTKMATADPLGAVRSFEISPGRTGRLVSLPALEERGFGPVSRLPVSLRIVLEALARHVDGERV